MSATPGQSSLDPREMTRLFRVLSDDTRLRLLRLLRREELTVNELSGITQLAQPRISNHLKILREESLIAERRAGSWRHYRVDAEALPAAAQQLWPTLEAAWDDEDVYSADDNRLREVLAARDAGPRSIFFEELAGRWDDIRASLFGDALGREILRALIPADMVVADVGTGTGYMLTLFGERASRLIAIDNSEAMLDQARAKMKAHGLKNVEFRLADAETTPLKPAEADVITIVQGLHHLEKPGDSILALAQGLKPGGRLVVSDFLPHQEPWLSEELRHRWNGFSREEISRWFQGAGLTLEGFHVLAGRVYESPDGDRVWVPDGFTAVGTVSK